MRPFIPNVNVEIRVDLQKLEIKETCLIISFSVMTQRNKKVGHQKRNLLTKVQLKTKNSLITR